MPSAGQIEPIVLWGASGHALVVIDILRLMGGFALAGLIDDAHPERAGTLLDGVPILGGGERLTELHAAGVRTAIMAFGNSAARLRLGRTVENHGFTLTTAIHPRAVVAGSVTIGRGTVVAAGAVVNPYASIGTSAIVNTGAVVDHECVIEDGAHVCPGARLAGNVVVGRAAWVGVGSTVKERVRIGQGALVGAGAVVVRDIPEYAVAYGNPARVVRVLPHPEA
jgi:UDP-N-acetylbacillosamine N-acetyltransferase